MKICKYAPHKLLVLALILASIAGTFANDEPYFMRWLNRLDNIKITDTDYKEKLTNLKEKSSSLHKQGKTRGSILLGFQAIITDIINEHVAHYLFTKASGKTIQKTDTDHNAIRVPSGKVPKGTRTILQSYPELVSFLQGTLNSENLKFIGEPFSEIPGKKNSVWLKADFIKKLNGFIDIVRFAGLAVPKESDRFFVREEEDPTTQTEMVEKSKELFREKTAYYEYLMKELKKTLGELETKKDPNRYYLAPLIYYVSVMKHINESKNKLLQASKQAAKEARADEKKAILESQYDIQQKITLAGPLQDILADSHKKLLTIVNNWPAEADTPPPPGFSTAWKIIVEEHKSEEKLATSSHLEKLWYPLEELSTLTR